MVNDIAVPASPEIQWQIDQNDGMPLVSLSTMLRSFHQFLVVQLSSCCHQRFVKLNSESSGIGFQCLDLIPGVALKGGLCDFKNTVKTELHLIASTI